MSKGKSNILVIGDNTLFGEYLSHYLLAQNDPIKAKKMNNIPIVIVLLTRQLIENNQQPSFLERIINDLEEKELNPNQLFIINPCNTSLKEGNYSDQLQRLSELQSIVEIQLNREPFDAVNDKDEIDEHVVRSVGTIITSYVKNPPNRNDYVIENWYTNENINPIIGVVGLGYVGLPVALGFSSKYDVIGFDINKQRISSLKNHVDDTKELSSEQLKEASITFTSSEDQLRKCNYIIVSVPTPITSSKDPDLSFLKHASKIIGKHLNPNTIVIYESTVYPGTTEEICIPILEKYSSLQAGTDFYVGYSPERINPGDKEHTFKTTRKVVSGQNEQSLQAIYELYQSVLSAQVYKAASIKVAEASKIIENTQRDVNIALMNELSLIFERLHINTNEVLQAANTKWNFLQFTPGLVGGHCIGVDPHYLIYKSKINGYSPNLLTSARTINDYMPEHVVESLLHLMIKHQLDVSKLLITVLGVTFKENIPDLRNSKSLEIVNKLQQLGLSVQVCDPHVLPTQFEDKDAMTLKKINQLEQSNIILIAVPHKAFTKQYESILNNVLKKDGIIMDLKGVISEDIIPEQTVVWKL